MFNSHAAFARSDRAFLESVDCVPPRVIEEVLAEIHPGSLPEDRTERQRWLLYAALQRTTDTAVVDVRTWANEERVGHYLDLLCRGALPENLADLGRWLKNLPANRAQKHARRRRLLERFQMDLVHPQFPPPHDGPERADDLRRVRRLTSDREWHLLRRASVDELAVIAASERLALGTLKCLLSRCRARLRRAS